MSVATEMHGDVALVTMDDGKANAVSMAMLDVLEPALDDAAGTAKAVVLAGRPGKFCAGFDLRAMQGGDPSAIGPLVNRGGRLIHRLYGYPLPLVAAVTGHGIALGALMLLACDTRIGAQGPYKFGLNETAIGMALPVFGTEMAKARLAASHVTASAVQARIYDPHGAAEAGFLDRVVPEADVLSEAIAHATQMAAMPTDAYVANKLATRTETLNAIAASLSL
ncbi:MAG: crotonase/enoyl-CoA hydratase family protein [Alphaproteobacteria bacterium]